MRIFSLYHSKPRAIGVLGVLIAVTLLPAMVQAQVAAPTITMVSAGTNGFNCSAPPVANGFPVLTWKLGASVPPSISAGGRELGAGRPSFSDVTITKLFDECSAALINNVAQGRTLQTVTLTQSLGGIPKMTVVLSNALVSSYDLSGGTTSPFPTEMVSFRYERIVVTNLSNGSRACFNIATASSC